MTHAFDRDGVPIYIDQRLLSFFESKPLRFTAKGFGPFRNLKLIPDQAFSKYVADVMDRAWDSPLKQV